MILLHLISYAILGVVVDVDVVDIFFLGGRLEGERYSSVGPHALYIYIYNYLCKYDILILSSSMCMYCYFSFTVLTFSKENWHM